MTSWWLWWHNRNRLGEGALPMIANDVVRRVQAHVLEYAEAFAPSVKAKCSLDRWRPPEMDVIKINMDGAFTPGESYAGWGVVARDELGYIVGARAAGKITSLMHSALKLMRWCKQSR